MTSFSAQIHAFANKTETEIKQVRKQIQKEVVISITKATPVDTGQARKGWKTSSEPFGQDGLLKFTNNLPYIRHLEFGLYSHATNRTTPEGYSNQAPSGMARINLYRIGTLVQAKYG